MRKELVLEEYEIVCDKCSGEGTIPVEGTRFCTNCPKCLGDGKIDWIENIVGKRRVKDILDEIASAMAEELAKEIDKEIMKELMKENENAIYLKKR